MISLFNKTLKHSADMLSSIRKHKKTVVGLSEKIHLLDKLCSGLSYNVSVGLVNANESTRYMK